jgi:hypothetical protein
MLFVKKRIPLYTYILFATTGAAAFIVKPVRLYYQMLLV